MNKQLIEGIKRKKVSSLSDSIVEKVAGLVNDDVKKARALLRKYFGVFLTNRILKAKCSADEILRMHFSSKKRNYENFYAEIFSGIGDVSSVIDLGSGMNGFSYFYLKKILRDIDYVAFEAVGQLVENMNIYFKKEKFSAKAIHEDLFNVENILKILKKQKKPRVVFMFQVIDALENLERNFSKKFILEISGECEWIVLSLPMESLSGKRKFVVQRKWIVDFLSSKDDSSDSEEKFIIEKDFVMNGERVIIIRKKTNN